MARIIGVDFKNNNRIEILAKLREEAVLPLRRKRGGSNDDRPYEASVFFNDVYFSGAQLLELIHQVHPVPSSSLLRFFPYLSLPLAHPFQPLRPRRHRSTSPNRRT